MTFTKDENKLHYPTFKSNSPRNEHVHIPLYIAVLVAKCVDIGKVLDKRTDSDQVVRKEQPHVHFCGDPELNFVGLLNYT